MSNGHSVGNQVRAFFFTLGVVALLGLWRLLLEGMPGRSSPLRRMVRPEGLNPLTLKARAPKPSSPNPKPKFPGIRYCNIGIIYCNTDGNNSTMYYRTYYTVLLPR